MSKHYSESIRRVLDSTESGAVKAALERALTYMEKTHDQFVANLRRAKENPIDDRGVLAGPLKRQALKPLKLNKSKARKLAQMAKNK